MRDDHDREQHERAEKSTFKVVDRRRFTSTGEIRADAPADAGPRPASPIVQRAEPAAAQPAATPKAEAGAKAASDAAQPAHRASAVDFLSFVSSLATNAMAAMGLLPPSQSRNMPQNLNMAREYIEIIVMLQERTVNNLSADEDHAMTQLISDLSAQYVQAHRTAAAPSAGQPG